MKVWVPIELPEGYEIDYVNLNLAGHRGIASDDFTVYPVGPLLECVVPSIVERIDLGALTNTDVCELIGRIRDLKDRRVASQVAIVSGTFRTDIPPGKWSDKPFEYGLPYRPAEPQRERWEYHFEREATPETMQSLGAEGWEVYAITTDMADGYSYDRLHWFKRRSL